MDAHADRMGRRHGIADGRIEAAQAGVPGASAAALSTAMAQWQKVTTGLVGHMVDHAARLRDGAALYQQADQHSAEEIASAAERIRPEDMGL
ncbi:hypothetical protein [Mycobacterium sp. GA-1199]|uniref:hypothetical protein n=1 Tax=Mycobacterium sp. GA-1199 TaxID=1772287 RepID=UPI003369F926